MISMENFNQLSCSFMIPCSKSSGSHPLFKFSLKYVPCGLQHDPSAQNSFHVLSQTNKKLKKHDSFR